MLRLKDVETCSLGHNLTDHLKTIISTKNTPNHAFTRTALACALRALTRSAERSFFFLRVVSDFERSYFLFVLL